MTSIAQWLQRRLFGGFFLLMATGGAGLYLGIRTAMLGQFDDGLLFQARALGALAIQKGEHVHWERAVRPGQEFDNPEGNGFFQIRIRDQETLRRSVSLGTNELHSPAALTTTPAFWNVTLPDGNRGRAVGFEFMPTPDPGPPKPKGKKDPPRPGSPIACTIIVARNREAVDETLRTLLTGMSFTGLLIGFAGTALVRHALRHGLAQLHELGERAAHIDANSLGERFSTTSTPAELAPITDRLNGLLARLEDSFNRERRFSSDLAHELRTPIAELRTAAEVALKWPTSDVNKLAANTREIAVQMEHLVNQLLTLARSEQGQLPLDRSAVRVNDVVRNALAIHVGRLQSRQISVATEISGDCVVQTDATLFHAIVNNLLSNAATYTPERGKIEIHGRLIGGKLHFQCANTATDISVGDLPHLFERLWRKEASRTDGAHAGLGLALSRSFAEQLGFQLTVALPCAGWIEFRLTESAPETPPRRPVHSPTETPHPPATQLPGGDA